VKSGTIHGDPRNHNSITEIFSTHTEASFWPIAIFRRCVGTSCGTLVLSGSVIWSFPVVKDRLRVLDEKLAPHHSSLAKTLQNHVPDYCVFSPCLLAGIAVLC